jgi:OPA family glycerol-3-phosphate transporter-like MFS transporter 1/2
MRVGMQIIAGLFQSTGWPSVVSIVANWSGKVGLSGMRGAACITVPPALSRLQGKRGLIMGIWNAHTSVGNIIGTIIAAALLAWVGCWSS